MVIECAICFDVLCHTGTKWQHTHTPQLPHDPEARERR